jgi:hypothetical protein
VQEQPVLKQAIDEEFSFENPNGLLPPLLGVLCWFLMGRAHFVVRILVASVALNASTTSTNAALPQKFYSKSAPPICGVLSGELAQAGYQPGCVPGNSLRSDFRGVQPSSRPAGNLGGLSLDSFTPQQPARNASFNSPVVARPARNASFNTPVSHVISSTRANNLLSPTGLRSNNLPSINSVPDYFADRLRNFGLPSLGRTTPDLSGFGGTEGVILTTGTLDLSAPTMGLGSDPTLSSGFGPISNSGMSVVSSGTLTISNLSGVLTFSSFGPSVPEPTTLALLAIGGAFLASRRHARDNHHSPRRTRSTH